MADLQGELRALRVEWPETPDLAGAVAARVAERGSASSAKTGPAAKRARGRRSGPAWRQALSYGLAAAAAAFALTMAVSPDARSAVLEWLGLRSVRIERREPAAPPPQPGTLGDGLGLGTPVTLEEARVRLPDAPGLGRPDAVYVEGDRVSLVYGERPGYARAATTGAALLVQEQPARVEPFIEKSLGDGARLERLSIDGAPAFFIAGAHGFAYQTEGSATFEEQRLAGNTLLVERPDGLLLRIEGDIARDRAIAVARSIP